MDLVDTLLPAGRIHLFGGAAGAGKTTVISWMLRQIQLGNEVFGKKTNPPEGGVYFLTADRPWRDYQEPISKAKLDLAGFYSFSDDPAMTYTKFCHPNPVPLLQNALATLAPKPKSVVVIDVLGLFLGDDLRRYRPIMGYMWEYNKWCEDKDITIIGSVHATKQRGQADRYVRLFDRVMGAGPLQATCSTTMYLASKEETGSELGYQEFEIAPRNAAAEKFQMVWDSDGLLKPGHSAAPVLISKEETEILALIDGNPEVQTDDLAQQIMSLLGIGRNKAYDWIKALSQKGLIARSGASRKSGWVRVEGEAA